MKLSVLSKERSYVIIKRLFCQLRHIDDEVPSDIMQICAKNVVASEM